MALEIKPEPTREEREAIVRALADHDASPQPSAWWAAGLRESVGEVDHGVELRTAGTDPFEVSR
jgi:hypothetical protein